MTKMTLPRRQNINKTCYTDPVDHYYRPVLGYMYRKRIEAGLVSLGDIPRNAILEIGYGSGILLKTLSEMADELYAIDIHPEESVVAEMLKKENCKAVLSVGDLCGMRYPNDMFDAVVSFSTLEHVVDTDQAAKEIDRVLRSTGTAVIGVPTVGLFLDKLLNLLGQRKISEIHVSDHNKVLNSLQRYFKVERTMWPRYVPKYMKLYMICKCTKRGINATN